MESEDQPGDSVEAELTQIRAKRLTRAERLQYLENEDFEDEVWRCHLAHASLHMLWFARWLYSEH